VRSTSSGAAELGREPCGRFGVDDLVDDEVTGGRDQIDRRARGEEERRDLGERGRARVLVERGAGPDQARVADVVGELFIPR
jgi:hypothetical protein